MLDNKTYIELWEQLEGEIGAMGAARVIAFLAGRQMITLYSS
jgi:hypothetical protein